MRLRALGRSMSLLTPHAVCVVPGWRLCVCACVKVNSGGGGGWVGERQRERGRERATPHCAGTETLKHFSGTISPIYNVDILESFMQLLVWWQPPAEQSVWKVASPPCQDKILSSITFQLWWMKKQEVMPNWGPEGGGEEEEGNGKPASCCWRYQQAGRSYDHNSVASFNQELKCNRMFWPSVTTLRLENPQTWHHLLIGDQSRKTRAFQSQLRLK